jgi:hypothetical protein
MVHLSCNIVKLQYSSMVDNKVVLCDSYIVDSGEKMLH